MRISSSGGAFALSGIMAIIVIGLIALAFFPTVYGLILAFQASILLGVIYIVALPTLLPFITGFVMIFWKFNIAAAILRELSKVAGTG